MLFNELTPATATAIINAYLADENGLKGHYEPDEYLENLLLDFEEWLEETARYITDATDVEWEVEELDVDFEEWYNTDKETLYNREYKRLDRASDRVKATRAYDESLCYTRW